MSLFRPASASGHKTLANSGRRLQNALNRALHQIIGQPRRNEHRAGDRHRAQDDRAASLQFVRVHQHREVFVELLIQPCLADFLAENRVGRAQRAKPLRRHFANESARPSPSAGMACAARCSPSSPSVSGDCANLLAEEQRQRFKHRHAAILPCRIVRAAQKVAVIGAHHQRLRAGNGLRLPDHLFMQAGKRPPARFSPHRLLAAKCRPARLLRDRPRAAESRAVQTSPARRRFHPSRIKPVST